MNNVNNRIHGHAHNGQINQHNVVHQNKKRKHEGNQEKVVEQVAKKLKSSSTPSTYERVYPPIGRTDTVVMKKGEIKSIHGTAICFQDKEIIAIRGRSLPPPAQHQKETSIAKTQSGKSILQQQATRGCTAACVEMLKADNGKQIDWQYMRATNLGNTKSMKYALESSGLKPLVQNVAFEKINDTLCRDGSAIIGVDTGFGGHVVIVDKIDYSEKIAYIREPYHGWAIAVTLDAFRKAVRHDKPELIQVKK